MKLLSLLSAVVVIMAAPSLASAQRNPPPVVPPGTGPAQTYSVTSSFTTGTGDVSGTFTFNPPTNTVTSASITTTAGDRQLAGGPIGGATYSNILSSGVNFVRISSGPPALGGRTIELSFSPNLTSSTPSLTSQAEATCTSADCGSAAFDRQGVSNASVTPLPSVLSLSPTSGPTSGGTSVTITGSGFTGATSVTFGGTPAAGFTLVSPTQITATSPAGGVGPADVRVTTSNGVSANTAADDFTYGVVAPVPTMSEWAMILFGTILAGGAALYIQRRRMMA